MVIGEVRCLPPRRPSPLRAAWEARRATRLLLVANGAGLAPFLALFEKLAAESPECRPPAWLWVGCRRREGGLPHQERLAALEAEGVLRRLAVAESNPTSSDAPRCWVQDVLRAEAEEVGQLLLLALNGQTDCDFGIFWV